MKIDPKALVLFLVEATVSAALIFLCLRYWFGMEYGAAQAAAIGGGLVAGLFVSVVLPRLVTRE